MKSLLLVLLSFCFAANTLAAGVLKVGISPDYEPLAYMDSGELKGIEVENAREVARIMGRTVEFVEMPLVKFVPSLEIDRVDVVMSGFTVTAERSESVDFVDPFMLIGKMAIVRTRDVVDLSHPDAMYKPGLRIAVQPDTTGQAFADKEYKKALIQSFPDNERAFNALRKNISDVYLHDAPTSWGLWKDGANKDLFSLARPLTEEGLAWAVRKGNRWLLQELNNALAEMRASGKLLEIQNRWIPAADPLPVTN
jgi:ABC-type amino acid transport substrate-binding protein